MILSHAARYMDNVIAIFASKGRRRRERVTETERERFHLLINFPK